MFSKTSIFMNFHGWILLIGSKIFEKVVLALFIWIFLIVSVLAHLNEVTMVVKLMTPLLAWPFALKAFFYYKCIYVLLKILRVLWILKSFLMFYISNCLQIFIKLSLALNRGFFCKVRVKVERYDNMYMQHGII